MNEDLSRLSSFVLCKHLEIIRGSDTLVSADNKATTAIFKRIQDRNGVKLELVINE
jgi:hypothetical protein